MAFFEDGFDLLSDPIFSKFRRKLTRRHGWIDQNYVYLPIRQISTQPFDGEVMNLEVEDDHSYLTEFATVHNCWTPWYSLYGSNSGYDFFGECFGEYSDKIYAVETGLSSEPAMNWRIADLDNKTIVSFSDPHSLPRLARECTMFKGHLSFDEFASDLKNNNILGTIEFFPEEGKYHYSGHRNCNIIYSPEEVAARGPICPVCQQKLTIGVMQRIEDLATRSVEDLKLETTNGVTISKAFPNRPGFRMLVQLEEIIAQAMNTTVSSVKVKAEYERLVTTLDNELKILTKTPIDLISMVAGERLADGINRVRQGKIEIDPGYDNTYGKVTIWSDIEEPPKAENSLF